MNSIKAKEYLEQQRDRFRETMACEMKIALTEAIAALEKQMPESPDYEGDGYGDNGELIYDTAYCPNCQHVFEVDYDKSDYCPECGQKLDWSEIQ